MSDFRVAIAGGGLAGMTLARHLHHHGLDVVVHERDADLLTRNPGYRLHINSTGTTALKSVLDPRLWELFVATAGMPRQQIRHFDEQLNPSLIRDTSGSAGDGKATGDVPEHLVADRSTMRKILYTGLEKRMRFGARVIGYRHNPGARVTVCLSNGENDEADVLVGANGINSAVRAQLLPHASVIDRGVRHIAARIPLTAATKREIPDELYSLFTLVSDSQHDMINFGPLERSNPRSPLVAERDEAFRCEVGNDFALSIFSSLTTRLPADAELSKAHPEALRRYVLKRIASWHPGVVELVRMWTLDTVQPLALRRSVPTSPWAPTNITVIGDAIHAMSPALGIGANTALRDAQVLGAELVAAAMGGKPLLTAVSDYEHTMRGYAFDAVRASAAMGERIIGHAPLPART
ncbi:FAD-dependent oxidoreductase [Streptantibioticus rubrisoli]|uniref:FAD-dependent monooxygenase n=1 Tax=Streptantibioticus rubrisoli TaxID=1387313 RepID=A0ABT1PIY8_9ACTN|nr:NAD(P)/FAD-dependent oxidoreductase [Streptantibioticus rubrisoli]MCQ4044746.1 FAD-dependent monooxygenase [Streptantibioticus rubrisoli]